KRRRVCKATASAVARRAKAEACPPRGATMSAVGTTLMRLCSRYLYAKIQRVFFVELAQFFSDDQTLRERRKQSTALEEPSASKRCSSTPLHWKRHFSRMLRDVGLATRAQADSVS